MATRNKRKLAALNKENCEEHPRNNLAQNSNVPRLEEDYITQVSGENEGRVTRKLSQEFIRTENRILCALARLDDFLTNPLIQSHAGTAPETSRNVFSINQYKLHPEAGLFNNQMAQGAGPEVGHDRYLLYTYTIFIYEQLIGLLWRIGLFWEMVSKPIKSTYVSGVFSKFKMFAK